MGVNLSGRMRQFAWASLVANVGIVVTGGAVRLTGSGLGCPTWPRCTEDSFTPQGAMGIHEAIEFGNRMLTFVLVAVAVATFVAAWQTGRRDLRRLATVLALGIPAQAVVGGITVLTDLNSWIVSFHLLISLAMIAIAVLLLRRVDHPAATAATAETARTGPVVALAWALFAVSWVVFYLGTVVTGSGPHAGDINAERNGLDPAAMSQLHTDAVFLLVGLTIGLLVAAPWARKAVAGLIGVELAQGSIGFIQYFTDLPEILVGLHLLGAAVTSAVVTHVLLEVRSGGGEAVNYQSAESSGSSATKTKSTAR